MAFLQTIQTDPRGFRGEALKTRSWRDISCRHAGGHFPRSDRKTVAAKVAQQIYITRFDCSRQPAGTAMDHLCMRQAEKRLRNGCIRRSLSREFDLRDIKLHPAKPSGEKVFQHALSMQNAAGHKGRALRVIRQRPCRRCEARQFSRLALYCEAEPGSYTRTPLMCSCHAVCACLRYPAFVQIASAVQEHGFTQQMAGSKVVHATKVVASQEHFVYSFKRGMRVRSNEGGDNERPSYITIPTWTLYHRVAQLVTHINRINGPSLMYSACIATELPAEL